MPWKFYPICSIRSKDIQLNKFTNNCDPEELTFAGKLDPESKHSEAVLNRRSVHPEVVVAAAEQVGRDVIAGLVI